MQVSSIGGVMAFPSLGIYHSSKWAVEGLCESLAQEVSQFGIHVSLIEPAGYATDWGTNSAKHSIPNEAYNGIREMMQAQAANEQMGNPRCYCRSDIKISRFSHATPKIILGYNAIYDDRTHL